MFLIPANRAAAPSNPDLSQRFADISVACVRISYVYLCCADFFCVLHQNQLISPLLLCITHNILLLQRGKALNSCMFLCICSQKSASFLPAYRFFSGRPAIFSLQNCKWMCIILTLSFWKPFQKISRRKRK